MSDKYKIIEDPDNGFLRIDPIPTVEEINKYYKEEFYSQYKNFNDSELKVQLEENKFFDSKWEFIHDKCLEYFHDLKGRSLFDIGFGYAQALLYFKKRGLTVSGLEPSPEGVAYAKKHGLEVYQAGIEELSCAGSKRFDIVMILNVLEHLRKPTETILQIKEKLLTKDGLLVIDVANEFNDFQTAANAEYDLKQWWVCPPNHINYFSITSLCKLLDKCGYEIFYKEASFPMELFLLTGEVYVGDPSTGKNCHKKRELFEQLMCKHGKTDKLHKLYESLAELDLGRQGVIYAKPKI